MDDRTILVAIQEIRHVLEDINESRDTKQDRIDSNATAAMQSGLMHLGTWGSSKLPEDCYRIANEMEAERARRLEAEADYDQEMQEFAVDVREVSDE